MKYRERRPLERQIEGMLTFVQDKRFSQSVDNLGEYCKGNTLYYLQLDDKTFLVLNHYNRRRQIELQGFDLWLSKYDRASRIGIENALSIEGIKLCFKLPEDADIINDHYAKFSQGKKLIEA
jgi:hypothetical protein